VKNKVAQLTDLLKQLLRAKNGEGTSAQLPEGAPAAHIPSASQNQGANSANAQTTFCAYHPYPAKSCSNHCGLNNVGNPG